MPGQYLAGRASWSLMSESAVLHAVTCRTASLPIGVLGRPSLTEDGSTSWLPVAHRVSATRDVLEEAGRGLPECAAHPEALAVRLVRLGVRLSWGKPDVVPSPGALAEIARSRGSASLQLIRRDPSLMVDLQIGAWFDAPWLPRLVRRVPLARMALRRLRGNPLAYSLDSVYWQGVRATATTAEWKRLTRSSYAVLLYHRIVAEAPAGEERLWVTPRAFDRQLRLLRALGFRPLAPEELFRLHEQTATVLPRRRYVLTADDGFLDAAHALRRHSRQRPQLFVATGLVDRGRVEWSSDALASWSELRAAEDDGVAIGSHTRRHHSLPDSSPERLVDELGGSLADLRERLRVALPIIAYPQGRHDEPTRATAAAAGYRAAFTTAPGRNSPGTDPYRLRRISVKAWDTRLSFLWKVLTGQPLPLWWERQRLRAYRRRQPHGSGADNTSS